MSLRYLSSTVPGRSPRVLSTMLLLGVLSSGLLVAPSVGAQESPSALLERIRHAYRSSATVSDSGTIEITDSEGLPRALEWELAAEKDGPYRLELRPQGSVGELESRVVWRDASGATHVWDRGFGLRRPADNLVTAVASTIGQGSFEALALPLLLAGSDEALADPEALALEGQGRCGDDNCDILHLSRMAGDLETWMWVDADALVHRIEIVHTKPGGSFLGIRVDHSPRLGDAVRSAFEPPAGTRIAGPESEWPGPIDDAAMAAFAEEITVKLLTATVRIVDSRGNPVPNLGPDDFQVIAGEKEVELSAVDWIPARGTVYSVDADMVNEEELVPIDPPETQERLVVLFVQADFNSIRIKGHLKMLPFVDELLQNLGEGERVAVVSFDSHLKLWSDFTLDREETLEAVHGAIRFSNLPELKHSRGPGPFLAETLDLREAKDAALPERALELIGKALAKHPGDKDLIFLGWGLGRYTSFGMRMDFGPAVAALRRSKTTVHVLDVTDADLHTLEIGLRSVAARTGGTYAKTNRLAAQATRNLLRALSGHYVLTVDRDQLPEGRSQLTIQLRDPPKGVRILGSPRFTG